MVPLFTVIFVSKMACHLGIQNEIQALSDLITSKETFALIRPTLSRLLLNSFLHSSFFISSCVDNYGSMTTVLKTVKHSQVNVDYYRKQKTRNLSKNSSKNSSQNSSKKNRKKKLSKKWSKNSSQVYIP